MKISDLDFVRLLPTFMRDDEAVLALSTAMNNLIGEPGRRLHTLRTWDKIDELTEEECDALAWELDIDWYDASIGLAEKRETIKSAQQIKRKRGTKWAVERLISAYFGTGYVVEWYEMDESPFTFAVITTNGKIAEQDYDKFLKAVNAAKNARSQLTKVIYLWELRPGVGFNLDTGVHGYEYIKCGTTDRAATVGLIVRQSVEGEPEITAHGYEYTEAGETDCGTYPRPASVGIVQRQAVAADVTTECSAYEYTECGPHKCGEEGFKATHGAAIVSTAIVGRAIVTD